MAFKRAIIRRVGPLFWLLGVMAELGQISLLDRIFLVKTAEVSLQNGNWVVEITTEPRDFDEESWAPYLYHQGLRLSASSAQDLEGESTSWANGSGSEYPHPEIGTMYVFGHHDVRNCHLSFGKFSNGQIEVKWQGECDVFWDEEFSANVPFNCSCWAVVHHA